MMPRALFIVCLLYLTAGLGRVAGAKPIQLPPQLSPTAATAETRCSACHTVKGWTDVKFDHARTGFMLRGAHVGVRCKSCHPRDFARRVSDRCGGCHRDAHLGELGLRCEGCHEERSWRDVLFTADAHRRTNFPLSGAHALLPCEECHGKMRDRSFSRAPLQCQACHQADYQRAATRSIDHAAAGFSLDCRQCHNTWRFTPARFAQHDRCFVISVGPHRGIPCANCHTSTMGLQLAGTCATHNAACSSCHEHACARSAEQHRNVMGYACVDQKCYECHSTTSGRGP
jgi:hypothetical protein